MHQVVTEFLFSSRQIFYYTPPTPARSSVSLMASRRHSDYTLVSLSSTASRHSSDHIPSAYPSSYFERPRSATVRPLPRPTYYHSREPSRRRRRLSPSRPRSPGSRSPSRPRSSSRIDGARKKPRTENPDRVTKNPAAVSISASVPSPSPSLPLPPLTTSLAKPSSSPTTSPSSSSKPAVSAYEVKHCTCHLRKPSVLPTTPPLPVLVTGEFGTFPLFHTMLACSL